MKKMKKLIYQFNGIEFYFYTFNKNFAFYWKCVDFKKAFKSAPAEFLVAYVGTHFSSITFMEIFIILLVF